MACQVRQEFNCLVWSVACKVGSASLECKVWSVKCGVQSAQCRGRFKSPTSAPEWTFGSVGRSNAVRGESSGRQVRVTIYLNLSLSIYRSILSSFLVLPDPILSYLIYSSLYLDCLSIYLYCLYLGMLIWSSMYLSIQHMYPSILSIHPSVLSIYLSSYLSIYLSICLSIYQSICLFINLSIRLSSQLALSIYLPNLT